MRRSIGTLGGIIGGRITTPRCTRGLSALRLLVPVVVAVFPIGFHIRDEANFFNHGFLSVPNA